MIPNILIIDDNKDILLALRLLLKGQGYCVDTLEDPSEIPVKLKKKSYSLVILDMNFNRGVVSGEDGLEWLKNILYIDSEIMVVLMTAYGDVELAVKGMQLGAIDFIQKPWDNNKLLSTLNMALNLRKEREKNRALIDNISTVNGSIIGESGKIKEILSLIDRVAKTDVNVLITGENGTGKDLVAKEIYKRSLRSDSAYITVDMGALPENLFEAELFGYVKGAFTGADRNRAGKIISANEGTLFLDEIGNIPLTLQAKLLRILENRELSALGSDKVVNFDIRLISATNMSIDDMVKNGEFRQDLLYRINTVEIKLPSLRERPEDILLLFNHFLEIYKKKYSRAELSADPKVFRELQEYNWPGNVRELRHLVERTVILTGSDLIEVSDLNLPISNNTSSEELSLESVEIKTIKDVINRENGNLSKAAAVLGITRATLYRKMEKYGI